MQILLWFLVVVVFVGCIDQAQPRRRTTKVVDEVSGSQADQSSTLATERRIDLVNKHEFPNKRAGEWVTSDKLELGQVELKNERFQRMLPLPDAGYVPVEATAPTVKATVINRTDRYIARIRVHVRAFAVDDQRLIAAEITDHLGRYWLTEPGSSEERTFVLEHDGEFVDPDSWPDFRVETELLMVQFIAVTDVKQSPYEQADEGTEERGTVGE